MDVDQGDSILIHTGERNVLIDGGSESAGSAFLRYLWNVNVSHLDYLVVTHPHSETLQRLVSNGVTIYHTDTFGTIVFATDGTAVSVIPETYSVVILAVLALILFILLVILKSQKV